MISIIIPVYNEQNNIVEAINRVFQLEDQSLLQEVIVVQCQGEAYNVTTVISPQKGRAAQMNYGASLAKGNILLFLHADTVLPSNALSLVKKEQAGAFSLRFDNKQFFFTALSYLTTFRSRFFHVPYGDQALFMTKKLFHSVGGYEDVPLLEDVIMAKKIRPKVLSEYVITSSRQYQKKGIVQTVLVNRAIMLGFFLGIKPEVLSRWRNG